MILYKYIYCMEDKKMSKLNLGDMLFMGAMGVVDNISIAKTKLDMKRDSRKINKEFDKLSADIEKYKKIAPVIVSDTETLDKAITNKEKVIVVSNKDLFQTIKKNVDKDAKYHKHKTFKNFFTGIVAIGSLVPPFTIAGLAAGAALVTVSIGSTLVKKMRDYSWMENEQKDLLILLKVKGENSFDDEYDTIDYENARKYEG